MRVRIIERPAGVLERVSLSAFTPGVLYEVSPSLGHYLITQRYAHEVIDDTPMLILSMYSPIPLYSPFQGGVHIDGVRLERETADRPPRRSRNRRARVQGIAERSRDA